MAVAEARTAWQRVVNRCLVQEDAKRAPKLACCSSASPSLKQVDTEPANGADAHEASGTYFQPFNRNSSYCDLSPNSRWWLHLQPNYGYQRGLVSETVDSLDLEMENIGPVSDSTPKNSRLCDQSEKDGGYADEISIGRSLDSQVTRSTSHVNCDLGVGSRELIDVFTEFSKDSLNLEDTGYPYEASKKGLVDELLFDSEYPGIGVEKTEPWWRTADGEELALLVAQRSHYFMENCDLPQPQNNFVKRDHDVDIDSKNSASSMGPKAGSMRQHNVNIHQRGNLSFERPSQLDAEGNLQLRTCKSSSLRNSDQKLVPETKTSGDDESKAQLLKALRHSQTRAREAENVAKQAFAEKEHVVQLVFRQASQLFAYKQLFQLLQLENFYFQIKNNKNQPISATLPLMLPWVPQKPKRPRKKPARMKRAKRARPKYDLSRYAVVFALGLGLVGAGFLLGWTVGWMLPML